MNEDGIHGQEDFQAAGAARGEAPLYSSQQISVKESRTTAWQRCHAPCQQFELAAGAVEHAPPAYACPFPSLPAPPVPEAAESLPCPLEHVLSEVFRCYQARSPEELVALLNRRYRWASPLVSSEGLD